MNSTVSQIFEWFISNISTQEGWQTAHTILYDFSILYMHSLVLLTCARGSLHYVLSKGINEHMSHVDWTHGKCQSHLFDIPSQLVKLWAMWGEDYDLWGEDYDCEFCNTVLALGCFGRGKGNTTLLKPTHVFLWALRVLRGTEEIFMFQHYLKPCQFTVQWCFWGTQSYAVPLQFLGAYRISIFFLGHSFFF